VDEPSAGSRIARDLCRQRPRVYVDTLQRR
jgi:hypothetical protein